MSSISFSPEWLRIFLEGFTVVSEGAILEGQNCKNGGFFRVLLIWMEAASLKRQSRFEGGLGNRGMQDWKSGVQQYLGSLRYEIYQQIVGVRRLPSVNCGGSRVIGGIQAVGLYTGLFVVGAEWIYRGKSNEKLVFEAVEVGLVLTYLNRSSVYLPRYGLFLRSRDSSLQVRGLNVKLLTSDFVQHFRSAFPCSCMFESSSTIRDMGYPAYFLLSNRVLISPPPLLTFLETNSHTLLAIPGCL